METEQIPDPTAGDNFSGSSNPWHLQHAEHLAPDSSLAYGAYQLLGLLVGGGDGHPHDRRTSATGPTTTGGDRHGKQQPRRRVPERQGHARRDP